MSVFADLADVLATRVQTLAGCLVYYGRPGAASTPDGVRECVSVQIGDSLQVPEFLGDCVTWVTAVEIHCQARATPGVDRSPSHAAEALLRRIWGAVEWTPDLAGAMALLGASGYCSPSGERGLDLTSSIQRDVLPGAAPVGVSAITLYLKHHTLANSQLAPYLDLP